MNKEEWRDLTEGIIEPHLEERRDYSGSALALIALTFALWVAGVWGLIWLLGLE